MPVNLGAYVITCWLLAMVPGAGQALMLRQTLSLGRRAAWLTVAGTCTGLLLWSTGAAAGLSAVLLANPTAFTALRAIGGVILAALGIASLRALRRPPADPASSPSPRRSAFLAGLAVNLGNPKAGVFAISFIPQFVSPPGPVFASAVLLGALWAMTTACWYVVFIALVDRGRSFVSRPSVGRALQTATGVTLLLLGVVVTVGV